MLWITRIPTHRNDKSEISAQELAAIKRMVWERFGGLTPDGPGAGVWVADDGQLYDESSWRLEVVSDRDDYRDGRDMVREIGRLLNQWAMYFEVRYFDGVEIIRIE